MSSDSNSRTPSHYKHSSPVVNFLSKSNRTLLSRTNNGQTGNLLAQGQTNSRRFKETNSFNVFPVVKTPPAKRYSKVVNPFEAALAERLHLPLIGSPTLFQRPPTPQHSSTQFAWTIDDVSSLQPANVEPHETQFHDSPDPDYEAKAQSAISSYFKEQQIVPSPIDCPLRSQRIILSETPTRRIRDNVAQTVLSLPPVLPKDLEEALGPYFFFTENQQTVGVSQNISTDCSIDHEVRDVSLRRKLFDFHSLNYMEDEAYANEENCVLTVNSPPPQSPELVVSETKSADEHFHNSNLSDSIDKSSFGSLSPIVQSASPPNLKRKSCFGICYDCKKNDSVSHSLYEYRCPKETGSPHCKISPDRSLERQSSSPYPTASEMSTDSISNVKISCLLVDSSKRLKPCLEAELFEDDALDVDEDDIQVSQLSALSNISSESDTPRSKRRSASRKNLSQSFSFQCSPHNENALDDTEHKYDLKESIKLNQDLGVDPNIKTQGERVISECSLLCRTDSGFNESNDKPCQKEKTAEKHGLEFASDNADISMICCSTPSKY